ncbi:tetratricopeptide repeat protein [Aquimarina sp. MMG015]|uniref:tetratricopeptide repeat protein n=1 Tax=unclassified Aquimarina TaxID=2627091 RepID=UPI000E4E1368|nr:MULTISPECIES: tetratricopeptide repeat protein [unclassified Aquimarina]AXT57466.1 tetratricopeptide repeat protein [Aquimarina sp. AD1]MBQ4801284.1 tetratricopeptide repeat protein [Aquimarina sp. MMG015]RKN22961.1 tetratricopeptide repeat protein [Aquimarina sp. AD1]
MKNLLIIVLCFQFGITFSQEEDRIEAIAEADRFVATGNEVLVKDGNFPKAEGEYRKAISKNPVDPTAKYNLANAYYNTEKYDEAHQRYTEAVKTATSKVEKHKAFHNQGNTYMEQKKYKEAVAAYKNALRNNPKDDETRYNLALAKQLLEKQQNEDKGGGDKDNKDQNKDDKKDKEDKDKKEGENKEDKKEGGDDKDKKGDKGDDKEDQKGEDKKDEKGDPKDDGKDKKEDKKEGDGKPEEQKKQPQQAQGQLSPQQVKSLLEAMNNEERKVQDKINAKKAKGTKTKTEKDW